MVFSVSRFKLSLTTAVPFIRKYFAVLLLLQATNFFFAQCLAYLQEQRMTSRDDSLVPMMIVIALVGFLVNSVTKVIWTLLACHNFAKVKTMDELEFVKTKIEPSLIESLLAFFRAVIYGFAFVIPGFIKMIRYQFVIFIVALEKDYDKGQINALKFSELLSKRHLISLTFLFFIFLALLFPAGNSPMVSVAPVRVIGLEIFSFFIIAVETLYLLYLYKDLRGHVKELP